MMVPCPIAEGGKIAGIIHPASSRILKFVRVTRCLPVPVILENLDLSRIEIGLFHEPFCFLKFESCDRSNAKELSILR